MLYTTWWDKVHRMKNKNMLKFITFFILFYFNHIGAAMAYEEPTYRLLKTTEVYEIRYYEDRLAVQTLQVSGEDGAFRRLFRYISGENKTASKIAMTVPVLKSDDGSGLTMHFFLPKSYSKLNTPIPKADNVKLVTVKGGHYAVIKYSGKSTNKRNKKYANVLEKALLKDGLSINGSPIQAIYSGPFTPFFLRRNETMYRVDWE